MPSPRADLLDPADLAALGRIEVAARWIVDGFLAGLHRSPRKGFSVEFAEYRPYQPGDDLRFVDWKIAARSDRWVVKQYEEETNLRATLVLDVSRSMDWSGAALGRWGAPAAGLTKLAYAERLVAALALLLLRQRDAVGLVRFDDRVRSAVPPRARTGQWRRLMGALDEPGAGLRTSAAAALAQSARLIRRRGMVVLVSDLLMERAETVAAIRGLRGAGHDVVVLHIMDPTERDLPAAGEAVFVDPESGVAVPATLAEVRTAYRDTVAREVDEWRTAFASIGATYAVVGTDEPFGTALRQAFRARQSTP